MHIVILGASDIGVHISSLLSQKKYNVTLVDCDNSILEDISHSLDIATSCGEGTNWALLKSLMANDEENIFVAVTESDETNLISCSIAKRIGYKETIARIRNKNYVSTREINFCQVFPIDHIIGPEISVAYSIQHNIFSSKATNVHSFAYGRVQMRTLAIPPKFKKNNIQLKDLDIPEDVKICFINRDKEYIFPHGNDRIIANDKVTIIGKTQSMLKIHEYFNIEQKKTKTTIIIGGSVISEHLATLLIKHGIFVKIVEKDYKRCKQLAKNLQEATIIHGDGCNLEVLKSEGICNADALVTCMRNDSKNILIALLCKDIGVSNIMITISNLDYVKLLKSHGIDKIFSPRISVGDQVMSIIRGKSIISMASIYDGKAEVLEVLVSPQSKVIDVPLEVLGKKIPKDFLIGVIYRAKGDITIPGGKQKILYGDRVIVFTTSQNMGFVKEFF